MMMRLLWIFVATASPSSSLAYSILANTGSGSTDPHLFGRRPVFKKVATSVISTLLVSGTDVQSALAIGQVRAPLELLLPATRVKLYIAKTLQACNNKDVVHLKNLLSAAMNQQFMTTSESELSNRYLEIETGDAWQRARRIERENLGMQMGADSYVSPLYYNPLNTAIQSWGDKQQFGILRDRQRNLEKSNTMRAAFNAYTNNLVFGDKYLLNAQGDLRKKLIRNDALPNVNSVVVSDLDLRDLYRNQVLQSMEDAKAEFDYQLEESATFDFEEVRNILLEAQANCDKWFSFVPTEDAEAALQRIQNEQTMR